MNRANYLVILIFLASCTSASNAPSFRGASSIYNVPLGGSIEDVARLQCDVVGITPDRRGYEACMAMFSAQERKRRNGETTETTVVSLPPSTPDISDTGLAPNSPPSRERIAEIRLREVGGAFVVPVSINNSLTLDFLVDSGASDVSIPADVVLTLFRTGTLSDIDFSGAAAYRLADGSVVPSRTFRIRTLRVGNQEISNVQGSVAGVQGSLLLGQSFLKRFKSWSIDNQRHVLLLQ